MNRIGSFTICSLLLVGATSLRSRADEKPPIATPMTWTIGGVTREAIVFLPESAHEKPTPVILVFHGHGGSMNRMVKLGYQNLWPEAIIMCPQGLPSVTGNDPEGMQSGWQQKSGDSGDRDLDFVDAMLTTVRDKYKVDNSRVFATGHSNGGGFTYLLGAARPQDFAAIAPSAAGARGFREARNPVPVLHIAGRNDETVPFAKQLQTVEKIRKFNGCEPDGKPWAMAGDLVGTLYPSKVGAPVVWAEHPGAHKNPDTAPELIIRFFKELAGEKK